MPKKLSFTKNDYFKMLDSKLGAQPAQRPPESLRGMARRRKKMSRLPQV